MEDFRENNTQCGEFDSSKYNSKIIDVIINLLYELKSSIPDSSSENYLIENLVKMYDFSGLCFIKIYLSCDPKLHSLLCSKKNFLINILQQHELNNIKNNIIKDKSVITANDITKVSNMISLVTNKKFDIKLVCNVWGVSRSHYYNKVNKDGGLSILFPIVKKVDYINYLFFYNLSKHNKISNNYLSLFPNIGDKKEYINQHINLIDTINNYLAHKPITCHESHL